MPKPKKPMTNKEFLQHKGEVCPNCRSCNVDADTVDHDGSIGYGNCNCMDCGATWVDNWKLSGYSDLDLNPDNEE